MTGSRGYIGKCGAEGDRTPDLMNAIHALSQLSYNPMTKTDTLLPSLLSPVNSFFSIPTFFFKLRVSAERNAFFAKSVESCNTIQPGKVLRSRDFADDRGNFLAQVVVPSDHRVVSLHRRNS